MKNDRLQPSGGKDLAPSYGGTRSVPAPGMPGRLEATGGRPLWTGPNGSSQAFPRAGSVGLTRPNRHDRSVMRHPSNGPARNTRSPSQELHQRFLNAAEER